MSSQSVQLLSHFQLFVTPRTIAHQASLSITNSQSLPKPMSIDLMMPSCLLILCDPLLLFSCRMDFLDLLAVQGTLKSLLQHHSSKASILQHSAFFTVQLSHSYMTIGKTITLTR